MLDLLQLNYRHLAWVSWQRRSCVSIVEQARGQVYTGTSAPLALVRASCPEIDILDLLCFIHAA